MPYKYPYYVSLAFPDLICKRNIYSIVQRRIRRKPIQLFQEIINVANSSDGPKRLRKQTLEIVYMSFINIRLFAIIDP